MVEPEASARQHLKIVVVGHVDHGKSTLIGRLLHDTGSLPEGKLDELQLSAQRRGMPLEWSFVLDALQAERDQAVTIDTTQIVFRSRRRDYLIIDAPGHLEFLKNMISGAAQAEAGLLVVDAVAGLGEQTRRHACLLKLLGLRHLLVAINKMDLVGYDAGRFAARARAVEAYLGGIDLTPHAVIPISARQGDNLATRSDAMRWYRGPVLLEALDAITAPPAPTDRPLRLPVQDVYKFDARRIIVGRIASGALRVGDRLVFSPSNRMAKVKTIEAWPAAAPPAEAVAGQSVGITLDAPIFVERGDVASHDAKPPMLTHVFRARLFWLGSHPLEVGSAYAMKLATRLAPVFVQSIERVIDTEDLSERPATAVQRNELAEIVLRSRSTLALDDHRADPALGRFVLVEGHETVGGGIVSVEGFSDERPALDPKPGNLFEERHLVSSEHRALRNGHRGAVVWFTGLSGAGKSTLAMEVERLLFARGCQVYVLDGDNVRRGLNADLGFGAADRVENIRRVGEMAALFADAGFIVITAFISPYRADRECARLAAKGAFHEIYIKADLATCERRDSKGLYRRARAGEIADFTGISAPYEEPVAPALVVDTSMQRVDECVGMILEYVARHIAVRPLPAWPKAAGMAAPPKQDLP